jgi:hypothetical protein
MFYAIEAESHAYQEVNVLRQMSTSVIFNFLTFAINKNYGRTFPQSLWCSLSCNCCGVMCAGV